MLDPQRTKPLGAKPLDGRVALVTGSTSGIGLGILEQMAAAGASVVMNGLGDAAQIEGELARIRGTHDVAAIYLPANLMEPQACAEMIAMAVARLGKVDILVNNAGAHASGRFETITEAQWAEDIDLKLLAAVRFSRLAFPEMKTRKWGRILNILNVFAKAPVAGTAPTAVTRAATMALTKAMAGEGAAHNVLVNGLVVGLIDSDQHHRAWKARGEDGTYEAFINQIAERSRVPMKRMGTAEEFANEACFLASDMASYVTGVALNVDGGLCPVV